MKPTLRDCFEKELARATAAEGSGDLSQAWRHLERAHVLSQAHAWPHVRVHWRMFTFGWRQRNARELFGQVPRLVLAAPGSWLGRTPRGNTGGADVGILTSMPIPEDLQAMLDA
ncbi:MAG: DUF3703 domain-containing protein [Myxococcaceae bacterium]|nr:DUF3703 domain-containing protein [Myxococcaceae bacterium]MCI0670284.1 DUF3703 domain-containing protein [Myxococcaceae bacterium]